MKTLTKNQQIETILATTKGAVLPAPYTKAELAVNGIYNAQFALSLSKLSGTPKFTNEEVRTNLKFGRQLEFEGALYQHEASNDVEVSERKLTNEQLNLFANADFSNKDVLLTITTKELKALNAKRIIIKNDDELAKAFNVLEVSKAFYANYLHNLNAGLDVRTMFSNLKENFYFKGSNASGFGNANEDAQLFNRFFKIASTSKTKLRTVIVPYVQVTNLNGEKAPNVSVQNFTDENGVTKPMLFAKEAFQSISQSQLVDYLNKLESDGSLSPFKGVEYDFFKTVNGEPVRCSSDDKIAKVMEFASNLLYVDSAMDVEITEGMEAAEVAKRLDFIKRSQTAMRNGICLFDFDVAGKLVIKSTYGFCLRTGSQGRTQGFIATKYANNPEIAVKTLESIGHNFKSYVKFDSSKGKWFIDVSKMISRPGLLGSTSISITALNELFADVTVTKLEGGMSVLKSVDGELSALFTKDFTYKVISGLYKALDGVKAYAAMEEGRNELTVEELAKGFRIIDAAEHPLELTVGDGQFFYGNLVHDMISAQFGKDNGVNQFRISPATKGLGVYIPNLKELIGHDMILPESAVKVPYASVDLETAPMTFAIANFGKTPGHLKNSFKLNYQFMGALLGIDPLVYKSIIAKEFDQLKELLKDPSKLHDYKNFGRLIERLDSAAEDNDLELGESIASSLVTTFEKIFAANPKSHDDVWVQVQARKMLKKAFKKYSEGDLYVDGNYRYMVQDPMGIVKNHMVNVTALNEGRIEDISYDFDDSLALVKANEVYVPANSKEVKDHEGHVLAFRAPLIDRSEAQKLLAVSIEEYNDLRKEHNSFLAGVIVFSTLDVAAFAMGGADFDGDKCGVLFDKVIVDSYSPSIPVLDKTIIKENADGSIVLDEGCVFVDAGRTMPKLTSDLLENDGWKVFFDMADFEDAKVHIFNYLKEYALDTMEPSKIGLFTDYATKLTDAVHSINAQLSLESDPQVIDNLMKRQEFLLDKIALLRIVQGWEIDRSKHGGAFMLYLDLEFLTDAPTDVALRDVNGKCVLDSQGNKVWADLTWLKVRKGKTEKEIVAKAIKDSKKYKTQLVTDYKEMFSSSAISEFVQFAQSCYNKVFADDTMTANIQDNNLLSDVSNLHFTNPVMEDTIRKEVGFLITEYNVAVRDLLTERAQYLESLNEGKFYFASPKDYYKAVEKAEAGYKETMALMNEIGSKNLRNYFFSRYETTPNMELVIAKVAYEISYNRSIGNYVQNTAAFTNNPAKGTGYVWNVATDFMVALLSYMGGHPAARAIMQQNFKDLNDTRTTELAYSVEAFEGYSKEQTVDLVQSVLRSEGASDTVEAVLNHNEQGLDSYTLFSNGLYLGFVYAKEMSKLGFADFVELKIDSIDYKAGHSSAQLMISKKSPFVPTEEQKALYANAALLYKF